MKKVSYLVRTCGRPQVLRYSLESIRKQTYPDIEVIVVEDGENTAENLIQTEFADMDIRYHNTGMRLGRSRVGNIALQMASGEYLNFLDDDDMLYPNHTEVLLRTLSETQKKVAYAVADAAVSVYSKRKKEYRTLYKYIQHNLPFNRLYFTFNNFLPIQTVMFHRSLFEQYGGLREELDALEDWDMWLRYAAHEDFAYVNQVTSMYRLPLKRFQRDKVLYQAYDEVSKRFEEYEYTFNFRECNEALNYIFNEIRTPKWKKVIKRLLKEIYSK